MGRAAAGTYVPDTWPVISPKDKVGDWLESYVRVMGVPHRSSTVATSATYSPPRGEWTVEVEREGKPVALRPQPLFLATGMSGKRNVLDLPRKDRFRGDQHHSSAHPEPDAYVS